MKLEDNYFDKDYHYETKFVNKYIAIIRHSKDAERVAAYKDLLFKMMKDIVKKNISNYTNLIFGICRSDEMPDRDELVAECYIVFDKCVGNFKISRKYNFYFYFNKSLSRNFYREYQRELRLSLNVPITEELSTVSHRLHVESHVDLNDILMDNLGLSDLEKAICKSRIEGQRTSDFLKENSDVNSGQYSRSLRRIKKIINHYKEKGEI